MDGQIVFKDSFTFNPAGGTTFTEADIQSFRFSHTDPTPLDGNNTTPIFSFSANETQIVSAGGTIGLSGSDTLIFGFNLVTNIPATLFALFPGPLLVDGVWAMDGVRGGIQDIDGEPETSNDVSLFLIVNSSQPGNWQFVGDSALPEPGTLAVLALGLAAVGYARRRAVIRR
jgi:hypothetical protein